MRNAIFNVSYRHPNNLIDLFGSFLRETLSKTKSFNKMYHIAGVKSIIFKSEVSDHSPVIFIIPSVKPSSEDETLYMYKRLVINEAIPAFNISLYQNKWKETQKCENVNEAYTVFLDKYSRIHDNLFPVNKIKLKLKDLKSLWI